MTVSIYGNSNRQEYDYGKNYYQMLISYATLVETVLCKFGFKNVLFNSGEDFFETEKRVKYLGKTLER